MASDVTWQRIISADELPDGRVTTVTIGRRALCVTNVDGRFGVLDNECPHQGGPLGEGSIERGWLRCPWHGYDYSPCNGTPPPPFADAPGGAFAVEVRADGVYAAVPTDPEPVRTVGDVLVETMVNWGVHDVFGMVGHSNLGVADAMREAEGRGDLRYIAIRHEGAAAFAASAYGKLTGRPAACLAIAGPGSTNLLTGSSLRRGHRPCPRVGDFRPGPIEGQRPAVRSRTSTWTGVLADVAVYSQTVQAGSNHAELMSLACKHAIVERGVADLILPDEVQETPLDAPAGSPTGRVGATQLPRTTPS